MEKVFIIAEAGVNHNGNIKLAKKMIDVAAESGADAIKFQTFKADKVISKYAPKAEYQKLAAGAEESQIEMAQKLEFNAGQFEELLRYCKRKKMLFLSTPFDLGSIDLLAKMGLSIFKVPSGEITNLPYLRKIGALNKHVILSTGMSNMNEIKAAVEVLVRFGTRRSNIRLLHCNTEYPTPYEDVNLRAMQTIKIATGLDVGYSDHTPGIEVSVAAVALGSSIIEKHFTLDKKMKGPDHSASLEPDELKALVLALRNVEKAMGSAAKKVSPSESKNLPIARKSIIALTDIKKGETFGENNLTVKRPGNGLSPMKWDKIIGRKAKRDFAEDELIEI